MQNQQTKTYINGVYINEHMFNDGGSILKLSMPLEKVDELAAQLKANADTGGWVRLVIAKNRNPTLSKKTGKVIATHSMTVDTWQPKSDATPAPQPARVRTAQPAPADNVVDDVPF